MSSCAHSTSRTNYARKKILIDLDLIDQDGVRDGQLVPYEFCIPKNDQYRSEVMNIDSSLSCFPGSGKVRCNKRDQYLCIGNLHGIADCKPFRQVLFRLAELPYIEKIVEYYGE